MYLHNIQGVFFTSYNFREHVTPLVENTGPPDQLLGCRDHELPHWWPPEPQKSHSWSLSVWSLSVSEECLRGGTGHSEDRKENVGQCFTFPTQQKCKHVENMFERQINILNFQYFNTPMGNTFLYFTFISNTVIFLQMYACTCLIDAFMESSLASFFVSQKTIVLPWLPLYTWITSPMTAARWDQWHAMARCYRRNDRPGRDVSVNSPGRFLMRSHYISTLVDDDKCFHFYYILICWPLLKEIFDNRLSNCH